MSGRSDEGNINSADSGGTIADRKGRVIDDDHPSARTAAAKRMKKRELDRKCQRMARDRTKARMAYLERLVEDFQQQDSSGQIAALMSQLAEVRKERDTLVQTLQSIAKLSKNYQEPPAHPPTPHDTDTAHVQQPQKHTAPVMSENTKRLTLHSTIPPQDNRHLTGPTQRVSDIMRQDETSFGATLTFPWETGMVPTVAGFEMGDYGMGDLPNTFPEMVINTSDAEIPPTTTQLQHWEFVIPQSEEVCDCSTPPYIKPPTRRQNQWRFANEILTSTTAPHTRSLIQKEAQGLVEDVLVRAIVDGWESVESELAQFPSWQMLRKIDEEMFCSCSKVERLAVMRAMGLLIAYHATNTPDRAAKLPWWYFKEDLPLQAPISHSYAVEFLAWPALRRRMVFSQHRYCANTFWDLFRANFCVIWPYELRDCFTRDRETGAYRISPAFDTQLQDIRTWSMGRQFFQEYPELYSDIPAIDHIPGHISDPIMALCNPGHQQAPQRRLIQQQAHYSRSKRQDGTNVNPKNPPGREQIEPVRRPSISSNNLPRSLLLSSNSPTSNAYA
ncbi:hypothetical protein BP5796_01538 [Coleophoma crateriformis]|uniref:BZIP domain-containing protein n=1 Tax=Coleophoma crateriformis TaxID=565419 RepID=A0A3D8T0T0_9HELO|nr:hypothetical protein BP5796_01538 [Coleophoma crateriformis]